MTQIKVLVADDHPVMRKGIISVLSNDSNYTVVGETGNGFEALKGVAVHKPDLVIMDIKMPELGGILATERITKDFPDTKVIILSMYEDRQSAVDAFKAGAMAYILKGGDTEEILLAAKKVMSGLKYISPSLADEITRDFVDIIRGERVLDPFDSLSLREKEVLKLVAESCTTKEVAEKLFLSASTVKSYRVNLMKKLRVNDTASLVKVAVINRLIKLEKP
jgi:two-component system response regulator NreC